MGVVRIGRRRPSDTGTFIIPPGENSAEIGLPGGGTLQVVFPQSGLATPIFTEAPNGYSLHFGDVTHEGRLFGKSDGPGPTFVINASQTYLYLGPQAFVVTYTIFEDTPADA